MTPIFWGLAALMVVMALALLIPPLLRRQVVAGVDRQALNVVVHRDRLAELEAERAEGSLNDEQYRQAKEELERELLEDVGAAADAGAVGLGAGRAPALVVALLLPLLVVGLYLALGRPDALAPPGAPEHAAGPAKSFEEMVATLEAQLEAKPEDAEGWYMLGRSYRAMQRAQESAWAFGKAFELVPREPEVIASYAQALASANGNDLSGRPTELLEQALAIDPNHEQTLWIIGIAAFQRGDFPQAIGYWERVTAQLQPGSEDYQLAQGYIARARTAMGGGAAQQDDAAAPAPAAAGSAAIEVRVELAAGAAAGLPPETPVFVYARAAQGPRMPLAMVTTTLGELPLSVHLDDGSAMMAGRNLSSAGEVILAARVSASGNAIPQPGDWIGESGPLPVAATADAMVTVDRKVE